MTITAVVATIARTPRDMLQLELRNAETYVIVSGLRSEDGLRVCARSDGMYGTAHVYMCSCLSSRLDGVGVLIYVLLRENRMGVGRYGWRGMQRLGRRNT